MAKVKYKQNGSWLVVGGGGASGDYIEGEGIGKIFVSNAQPSSGETGDLWLDISSQTASGVAYLPLSAGSNHPLTNDLYIKNANNDTTRNIKFIEGDNNTLVGIIQQNSGGNLYVSKITSGTTTASGIAMSDTEIFVFGKSDSGNIYFRPQGHNSSTNQVYIDSNGVVHGGAEVIYNGGTKSVSATTVTDLYSITLTAGKWLLVSFMKGNTGSSGTLYHYIDSTTFGVNRAVFSIATNGGGSNHIEYISLSSSETIKTKVYSPVAQSITNSFYGIRVG